MFFYAHETVQSTSHGSHHRKWKRSLILSNCNRTCWCFSIKITLVKDGKYFLVMFLTNLDHFVSAHVIQCLKQKTTHGLLTIWLQDFGRVYKVRILFILVFFLYLHKTEIVCFYVFHSIHNTSGNQFWAAMHEKYMCIFFKVHFSRFIFIRRVLISKVLM